MTVAFITSDDICTDPVRVHSGRKSVTVTWGGTTVRLTISEAVDLVDELASVLAEKASLPTPTNSQPCRELHRDEQAVRAAVEIREAL